MFTRRKNKNKIECPRCLGKGAVDWDDIKRLNKELHWLPGECAYCRGIGHVSADMAESVDPGMAYLSLDISDEERLRLIKGDDAALDRARYDDHQTHVLISEIEYLHFECGLSINQIVRFYFLSVENSDEIEAEKIEMADYTKRVIALKMKTEANSD